MNPTALVLVDGHNLLWMAAMGTPASVASRDKTRDLTGAFMFFALLRKAVTENFPDDPEVLVVFDGELGSAARKTADPDYKANRPTETPLPIKSLPDVKRGLDAIELPWVELEEHEADDVIASAARLAGDRHCYIFSRDRDFYQLLDDRVRILNTSRAADRRIINAAEIKQRFGVFPDQWCDRSALVGDPSDNIAGVRGIGPTTAARLLAGGLHLEGLPGSGRLTGRAGEAVLAAWQQVLGWRDLARMINDIPLPTSPTGKPTPVIPRAAEVLTVLNLW
ncbi:5'-3' exonuclease H3TH domain-containing protein [Embleya sp. NPDC059237]|uniref:5'-3' exonuclease n=1 Tax=Embleya sp. NPDC059237 TaxID=3346784 RepID=UPI0036AC5EFF